MDVNLKFRLALLSKWTTMQDASKEIGIDPTCLSLLVRGRRQPTKGQVEKLRRHFSGYKLRKMFEPKPVVQKIKDEAVNL